jgi:hypothetical protein
MILMCRDCGEVLEGDVLGGAITDQETSVQFTVHIRAPECPDCGRQEWMPYLTATAPSDEDLLLETEAASDGDVWRLQCTWSRILRM